MYLPESKLNEGYSMVGKLKKHGINSSQTLWTLIERVKVQLYPGGNQPHRAASEYPTEMQGRKPQSYPIYEPAVWIKAGD
jgi:hypothetical protein